ncbi:hypothetical protein ACIBCM_20590 [Streptomyces sp. NPDC051018]|uniref:hypothetical protein n=1 Tax=Streptomyces sp. NPDC051018 TaxID=3365639 RepID=UPI0037944627
MVRRPAAVVAAAVLLVEAVGFVVINGILATFVDGQSMSLDGLDPDAMVVGTWVLGAVTGLFLAWCGAVCLLAAVRDRAPGRAARILLIAAAVLHGVLGAVTVGLVGWAAFTFMMVVLGLIVLVLVSYGDPRPGTSPSNGRRPGGPAPGTRTPDGRPVDPAAGVRQPKLPGLPRAAPAPPPPPPPPAPPGAGAVERVAPA